jgi:hypothetical protein
MRVTSGRAARRLPALLHLFGDEAVVAFDVAELALFSPTSNHPVTVTGWPLKKQETLRSGPAVVSMTSFMFGTSTRVAYAGLAWGELAARISIEIDNNSVVMSGSANHDNKKAQVVRYNPYCQKILRRRIKLFRELFD